MQEEVSEVISPFGRPSRVAEGPQLPRTDCLLLVPRKAGKTSDTVTFLPVARSREPGSQPRFPTFHFSSSSMPCFRYMYGFHTWIQYLSPVSQWLPFYHTWSWILAFCLSGWCHSF